MRPILLYLKNQHKKKIAQEKRAFLFQKKYIYKLKNFLFFL